MSSASSGGGIDEAQFISYLDQLKVITGATDLQRVDVGYSVCAALEEGDSPEAVLQAEVSSGLTTAEAAGLMIVSVKFLCPQFTSLVPAAKGSLDNQPSVSYTAGEEAAQRWWQSFVDKSQDPQEFVDMAGGIDKVCETIADFTEMGGGPGVPGGDRPDYVRACTSRLALLQ